VYISDVEKRAKGRLLQQRDGKPAKRIPRSAVRKALENAILALDRVMNDLDVVVEDFWTDEDGKPLTKGLPAKNHSIDAADQLYLAKNKLYRAIRLLENAGRGNVAEEAH